MEGSIGQVGESDVYGESLLEVLTSVSIQVLLFWSSFWFEGIKGYRKDRDHQQPPSQHNETSQFKDYQLTESELSCKLNLVLE